MGEHTRTPMLATCSLQKSAGAVVAALCRSGQSPQRTGKKVERTKNRAGETAQVSCGDEQFKSEMM